MSRRITPTRLSDLDNVANTTKLNGEGITFNTSTERWESDTTLEKITNKNNPNGYLGLDINGDIDGGSF